jgi:hypothetical protein
LDIEERSSALRCSPVDCCPFLFLLFLLKEKGNHQTFKKVSFCHLLLLRLLLLLLLGNMGIER